MCVRGGDEFEKQARKRTCHSKTLCMPDSGCSSMAGKRGDGGLCEEAFDVSDGLLHDAWPHDTLTQTPLDTSARSAWVDQWV